MPPIYVEPKADGSLEPITLPTGQKHQLVLRTLLLDHRYHDEDPVQEAAFTVRFAGGQEVSGNLDKQGRARLAPVPGGESEVRYGPDSRPYQPVEQEKNPDYRERMSDADVGALFDKYEQS